MGKQNYPIVHGFQLMNEIGGGGFSTVYRAVNFDTHTTAACKVVLLRASSPPDLRASLDKEMAIHAGLKHVNVLEFMHGLVVELPEGEKGKGEKKERAGSVGRKRKRGEEESEEESVSGEGEDYVPGVYMVLELAGGGDLFDKIEPDKGVDPDVAQHYFKQLAQGLEFLHSLGVCHRDLKPENLLLSSTGVLKISDFGLCAVFKVTDAHGKPRTRFLSQRCGSLPYLAPELSGAAPYDAEPIDVWGIGVILYALLSGNTPWERADRKSSEYTRYLSGEIFDREPWTRFERDSLSLITGMLTPDPKERMTLKDIFHHPWMMRENALTQRGPVCVAEALTQSLQDLDVATPPTLASVNRTDRDGDQIMLTAAHYSQFTQTLMLFSQTTLGRRYTPAWTRFYASILPAALMPRILAALERMDIRYRLLPEKQVRYGESGEVFVLPDDSAVAAASHASASVSKTSKTSRTDTTAKIAKTASTISPHNSSTTTSASSSEKQETPESKTETEVDKKEENPLTRLRLRIGGFDARRLAYKGTIELEEFCAPEMGVRGAFVVMKREKGNPISWRSIWKSVIVSAEVEPWVLRKRA